MLIDLLSTSNYISFNVKFAHTFGLHTAIYLQELLNINDKAIRKDKMDDKYFVLDREYIKSRTTLDETEQVEIDKDLMSLGILEKGEKINELCLHTDVLSSMLVSGDETLIKDINQIIKNKAKNKKKTKSEAIVDNLKALIVTKNSELRAAYYDWIDTVSVKNGWMAKSAIIEGQAVVDQFSGKNLDIALAVVKTAAVNGYRDMNWAVNTYIKDQSTKAANGAYRIPKQQVSNGTIKVSNEVF